MSDDLHSLSGAYVLDALTDDERADFEVHLERCPTCRDEVASLREVAPLLAETVATPPPSRMSAPPAAVVACVSADSMPSVTKKNVVPPSISIGSCA